MSDGLRAARVPIFFTFLLSAAFWSAQVHGGCDSSAGLDFGTGANNVIEDDYRGAGAAPLLWRRYYNSMSTGRGALGNNWRHHYQRSIVVTGSSEDVSATAVTAFRQDGRRFPLTLIDGAWQAPADAPIKLERFSLVEGPAGWRITTLDDAVETYDPEGRLISIETRSGLAQTFAYDENDRLTKVTDAHGRQLLLAYDENNRITTVTLPAGAIEYGYDESNRLRQVVHADTSKRTYQYNEPALTGGANLNNALTGITDESGTRFASFTYDAQLRATGSELAGGVDRVTVVYGADGTRTVTDALNTARTYGYTTVLDTPSIAGVSQLASTCGAASKSIQYDAAGNIIVRTDYNNVETRYAYDAARRLETSRIEAFGTPRARTIITQYHPTLHAPVQIDEPGRRTAFTHDAKGNVLARMVMDTATEAARTWMYTYNSSGQPLTVDGPRTDLKDVTSYTYHECTTGVQCGQVSTVTNALGQVTSYATYDVHGQPLTIVDPNGLTTTLTYDARQRLTSSTAGTEKTSYEYWLTGLLKKVTLPDASALTYDYDAAHRLTSITDGAGNRVVYTLDALGNRTREQRFDASGALAQTRTQVFNALNQLSQQVTAAGTPAVATTFGYDANGNRTSSNAPLARTTTRAYDEFNRGIDMIDAASGQTLYNYNALDQLISVTDPRGNVTGYTYNALGDLAELVSPDTGTTLHTYDAAGNLQTRTDARGKTAKYTYDALDRLRQVVHADQTIDYNYDQGTHAIGRLSSIADASGSTAWTYDVHGRVTSRQQATNGVSKTASYLYDGAGRPQGVILPSGNTVGYSYTNGRITGVVLNGTTTILSNARYRPFGPTLGWTWGNDTLAVRRYDTDGNLISIASAGSTAYAYDDALRIVGIADLDHPAFSRTYSYDSMDRLNGAIGTGLNQSWTYDASGNRASEEGDQPATYMPAASSSRLVGISGSFERMYVYDAAGNTLSDGTSTYGYDDAGRLISTTKAGVIAVYQVNALGQRVRKTVGGLSTYFFYDEAGHLLGEYDNAGATLQEVVWLDDIPVATLRPTTGGVAVYFIHTDHLNTPRKLTQPSDNVVVWRWDTDAFGTTAPNQDPAGLGPLVFNLRFPGQYADAESGLNYGRSHVYDPITGRYLQPDPVKPEGGFDTYAYAHASPIAQIDDGNGMIAARCRPSPMLLPVASGCVSP